MSTTIPCEELLRIGVCSNLDGCSSNHSLPHCDTCDRYLPSKAAHSGHVSTQEHLTRLAGADSEAIPLPSGKIRCRLCEAEMWERDWSNHVGGSNHTLKLQYRRYQDAKVVAESDKSSVRVTPELDLDFGVIDLDLLKSRSVDYQREESIRIENGDRKVELLHIKVRSKGKAKNLRHFSTRRLPRPIPILPGHSFNVPVHFQPRRQLGSFEDVLTFKFKISSPTFSITGGKPETIVIQRTVRAVVGVKNDIEAFSSTTPYDPPDLKTRPRADIETTVSAPKIKSKNNFLGNTNPLPGWWIPSWLQHLLENGTIGEIIKYLRGSATLSYRHYTRFWTDVLHVEGYQEDLNIRRYDIEDTSLRRSATGSFFLNVPGLAEKRPSVVLEDKVKVQTRNGSDKRWFEGVVIGIQSRRVELLFKQVFQPAADARFDVQFALNRVPARRQLQALQTRLPRSDLLFPTLNTRYNGYPVADSHPGFFSKAIEANYAQRQAVLSIFYNSSGTAPYVVFGPPGTGKTSTLIESTLQLLSHPGYTKILITAPSNAAADLLCARLNLDENIVFRLNAISRKFQDVPPAVLRLSYVDGETFGCPPIEQLEQYQIIVSTCMSSAILKSVGLPAGHFSHIFVDEAGQATEPETMIPLSLAGKSTNVILAGDPCQLGPIVHSAVAEQLGLGKSLLERIMSNPQYDHRNFAYRGVTYTKLVQNYRNHPAILATPNKEFYSNELQVFAPQAITHSLRGWEGWPNPDFPIIFHAIKGRDERDGIDPSFFNVSEISTIRQYVDSLTSSRQVRVLDSEIGVIAPYSAQCAKLRLALNQQVRPLLTVGTVEQFQGSERSVILMSTVRSNKEYLEQDKRFAIGFVGNEKRFNVAVTRAQAGLICVGDPDVLSLDPIWRRFLLYVHDNGGWRGKPLENVESLRNENYDPAQAARDEMQDMIESFGALSGVGVPT